MTAAFTRREPECNCRRCAIPKIDSSLNAAVFAMQYRGGRSYKEIAQAFGLSVARVKAICWKIFASKNVAAPVPYRFKGVLSRASDPHK
jgi:hypothetical protein